MSVGMFLTIIFVILKLTGVVNWTVLTLFVPMIVEFAIYGVVAIGALLVVIAAAVFD